MQKETIWDFKPRFCEIDKHGHVHNGVYCSYIEEAITDFCKKNKILHVVYFENNKLVFFVHSILIRFISPLQLDEQSIIKTNLSNFTKSGLSFLSNISTSSDRKIATSEVIWVNFCVDKQIKKNFSEKMLKKLSILRLDYDRG